MHKLTLLICGLLIVLASQCAVAQDSRSTDQQLLDDLPALETEDTEDAQASDGEDVGSESTEEAPVVRILNQMELSRAQLASGELAEDTVQLQREIAAELEELIRKLRERQPAPVSSASPMSSQMGNDPMNGQSNAEADSERTGSADAAPPDAPIGQGFWGHLPARVREQINSSAIDEFLPSYEEMIEAYYRRLTEQRENMPRQN